MNLPTFLQSSVDPTKISLTVESIGKALIGAVAFYASFKGMNPEIATGQLQTIIDTSVVGMTAVFTAYHSVMTIFGLGRKLFVGIFSQQ